MTDIFHEMVEPVDEVDIHHNFVAKESWFGRELLIHRKGAVSVPKGERALVPGSMGTASYVVEGLGSLAETMRRIAYPEKLLKQLVERRRRLIATSQRFSKIRKISCGAR